MDAAAIHRIAIIGAGTSGLQIALQFARFQYEVTVYDASQAAVRDSHDRLKSLLQTLVADGVVEPAKTAGILSRICITHAPIEAADNADLLIESVSENVQLKRDVLADFHLLCPSRTIFTTNTSYLLPSSMAAACGRPERFAAFHFHVPVWHANAVDVMPHSRTSPEVIDTLCDLAWRIGQVPILSRQMQQMPLPSDGRRVTCRYIPQAIPSRGSALSMEDVQFSGGTVVVGNDPVAHRLVARLDRAGIAIAHMPQELSATDAIQWLDRQWQAAPRPHLFLIAEPSDSTSTFDNPQSGQHWFEQQVLLPFAVTQAWFRLLGEPFRKSGATILACTRLGGTFGLNDCVQRGEDGGLAGLVKSVSVESMVRAWPGIAARVVDFAANISTERCIDTFFAELADAQSEIATGDADEAARRRAGIEVGYAGRNRYAISHRTAPTPSTVGNGNAPRGTWLVSGGGGGITMRVALALAQRYDLNLQVLGRTQLPETNYLDWPEDDLEGLRKDVMRAGYQRGQKPNEAWWPYARGIALQRALRAYRDAGVSVDYHRCNVADQEGLFRLMQKLHDQHQPVTGVLHGAGVERSTRLETKSLDVAKSTLLPKTLGTKALIEVTRSEPLEWFIAFGSLSGRFGSSGQADYSMANEMMTKMVTELRQTRSGCRGLTIHWPAWEGVGMAANPENRYMLEKASHHLMPVAEGVRHILLEVQNGAPDAEVVIVAPEEMKLRMHAEDLLGSGLLPDRPSELIPS